MTMTLNRLANLSPPYIQAFLLDLSVIERYTASTPHRTPRHKPHHSPSPLLQFPPLVLIVCINYLMLRVLLLSFLLVVVLLLLLGPVRFTLLPSVVLPLFRQCSCRCLFV